MATQQFCAYNQTRECFLGLHVTAADLTGVLLQERLTTLTLRADEGLWLMPFRGLPQSGPVARDLVFLDRDLHVLESFESFVGQGSERQLPEADSLLILPSNSIYSSNTQTNDQLVLCAAEELSRNLDHATAKSVLEIQSRNSIWHDPASPDGLGPHSPSTQSAQDNSANWADRRCAPREPGDGLAAYFWYGSSPEARTIRNISSTGLYLVTAERWYPGTLVRMALQPQGAHGEDSSQPVAVQSCVMRWGKDGVGLQFVTPDPGEQAPTPLGNVAIADPHRLRSFLDLLRRKSS